MKKLQDHNYKVYFFKTELYEAVDVETPPPLSQVLFNSHKFYINPLMLKKAPFNIFVY